MPDRLDKAINSVPDTSLPEDKATNTPDTTSAPAADTKSGEPGDKDGDRTIDNVRGELIRKMEKSQTEMQDALTGIRQDIQNAIKGAQTSPPAPQNTGPKTVEQMSLTELRTLRSGLPADSDAGQVAALDSLIMERTIDDRARALVDAESKRFTFKQREDSANETALERWPELRQRGEFYAKVSQKLDSMGDIANADPDAVLNAANNVGIEMGLSPANGLRSAPSRGRQTPTNVAGANTGPGAEDGTPTLSDEKAAEIASSLAGALPAGKKFDLKAVKARTEQYGKERFNGPKL